MGNNLSAVDRYLEDPDAIDTCLRDKHHFSGQSQRNIDAFLIKWAPEHPSCPAVAIDGPSLTIKKGRTGKKNAGKARKVFREVAQSDSSIDCTQETDRSSRAKSPSGSEPSLKPSKRLWDPVARTTSSSCIRDSATFDKRTFWLEENTPAGTGQARYVVESYYEGLRLEKSSEKRQLRWRWLMLFFSDLADEVVRRTRDLPHGSVLRLSNAETTIISEVLSKETDIEISIAEANIREWRALGRKLSNFCQRLGAGSIFYFSTLTPKGMITWYCDAFPIYWWGAP